MCDAAVGLARRGHAVRLIARPESALEQKGRQAGVEVMTIEMRSDLDPMAIVALARIMRLFAPDVVCVNLDREVRLCAVARSVARHIYRAPISHTRLIPRRGSEFPLKDKSHYRFVYTRLVDSVITNSEATRRTMLSGTPWFPDGKAIVIHNGVDVDPYDRLNGERETLRSRLCKMLGLGGGSRIVTLVGELNERKGHRYVIEAGRRVVEAVPEAHFLFVGEGEGRLDIEHLVEKSGIADHIHLVGFRDDVPQLLTGSDVLVLPSRVEGFGYVLAEAMASRVPVVATNASSIPEIVEEGETGYLHDLGDHGVIADRLIRLLTDEPLRLRMGENGHRVVRERFGLDRMIDRLERLFFTR